jgi:polysaccharide biosynthesis/export protein
MLHFRLALSCAITLMLAATISAGAQQSTNQNTQNVLPPPQQSPQQLQSQQQATQPQPARQQPAPLAPGATIEPGDQLSVAVFGDQSLSQNVMVGGDGTIEYPLIGHVAIAGKTAQQASEIIADKLKEYVKHPFVTVSVTQAGQQNVLVLGNVKQPGRYDVRSGGHLSDAIAAAGGLGPTNGDLPEARITESDGSVKQVSLQQLFHDGNGTLNVPIQNNAVVYVVGPNPIMVEVIGAVDRPGSVEINEGDRLSMAIARAGTSPNVYSDLNHVVITRTDTNGKTEKREIDMYNALKDGDKKYDPVLAKGDVVYVPMGKRPGGNAVVNPLDLITRLVGI